MNSCSFQKVFSMLDGFLRFSLLPAVMVILLAGCARYPRELQRYEPVTEREFLSAPVLDGSQGALWGMFQDETLQALLARGFAGNLSLRSAWHRLEQSGYALRASRAAHFPQLTLHTSVGQQRQIFRDGDTETGAIWSVSAALSYELDVWRRIAASVASAEFRFEASAMDYEAMAISVAAAITDAWLDLQERRAALALLQSQRSAGHSALQAVERRLREGLAVLLDVYQQRELVAGLDALLPSAEVAIALSRERLGILLGVSPDALGVLAEARIPDPVALTHDLAWGEHVAQRPDVRAAWLRLQSAERDRLIATRALFPAIRVVGQGATREEQPGDLFREISGDASLQVSVPVLDGGRLMSEYDRIGSIAGERMQAFLEVELQALREIREALLQDAAQAETIRRLGQELEAANSTLALSRERYYSGLVEYLNVLAAQQRVYQLERGLLRAQRQRLAYQVQFARATAGRAARGQ
jgi:outer membrane protein, multidrug efflux system